MKKIIIINGKSQSGKDTFINLNKKIINNNILFVSLSSITYIKQIALSLGWNGIKDDKSRKFLSDLKKLSIEFNNGPFQYIIHTINLIHTSRDFIVYVCIREPSEINKLVEYYGDLVTTLLIRRNNIIRFDNDYDNYVNKYNYNYIVDNNGTMNDLLNNVIKFMNYINCKNIIEKNVKNIL